jgi:hypothetical protein
VVYRLSNCVLEEVNYVNAYNRRVASKRPRDYKRLAQ